MCTLDGYQRLTTGSMLTALHPFRYNTNTVYAEVVKFPLWHTPQCDHTLCRNISYLSQKYVICNTHTYINDQFATSVRRMYTQFKCTVITMKNRFISSDPV